MTTRRPTRSQLKKQIRRIINESLEETYGVQLPLLSSKYYASPITETRIRDQAVYLCEGVTPGLGTGVTTFGSVIDAYDNGRITSGRMWNLMENSYNYEWARIWEDDDLYLLSEGFFGNLGAKADDFFSTAAAGVKKVAGVAGKAMELPGKVVGGAANVAKGAVKGAYNALPDAVKDKIEALMAKVVGFFEKMWDQAIKMAEKHLPTFTKIARKMIAFNAKFKEEHPLLHLVISKLIFMLIIYGAITVMTGGLGAAGAAAGKAGAAKGAGAAAGKAAAVKGAATKAAGVAKTAAAAGDAASVADAAGAAKTAKAAATAAKTAKAAKVAKAAKIAKAKKLAMAKKAAAAAKGKAAGGTLSNAKVKALKGLLDNYSASNPGMSDQALEAIKLIQNAAADGSVTTKEINGMGKMARAAFDSVNKVVAQAQGGDPVTQKYLLKLTKLGGRVVVK